MRNTHNIYVIELSKEVLLKPKFIQSNSFYIWGMPCVYVGMTAYDPDIRCDQHKAGIKCNKFAKEYGMHLLPKLFEHLNPMPYGDAQYMEVDLAIRLKDKGYGVWQA